MDTQQSVMTDYYECVSRMIEIGKTEVIPSTGIAANHNTIDKMESRGISATLLQELLMLFNKTGKRIKYPDLFKTFCTYLYILSGPKAYNTLRCALPIISLRTAQNHLGTMHGDRVVEGELRVDALKKFLDLTNSPYVVWLSEDATRIVSKLQIDPVTGSMIGVLLDKDQQTGMPIIMHRTLESINQLKHELNNTTMTINANVLMARPLKNGSPTFCLMVTGCDNKFVATAVTNRREFIISKLQSAGIVVPGSSSDGDSRFLRSQRENCGLYKDASLLDVPPDWTHWFNSKFNNPRDHYCIQDTTHIMGKMRNNLFNSGSGLTIGKLTCY